MARLGRSQPIQPVFQRVQAIVSQPPKPKISTLVDDFTSGTIANPPWLTPGASVTVVSGRARLAITSSYDGELSTPLSAYDLTSSAVFAKITPPTQAGSNGTKEFYFETEVNGSNTIRFYMSGSDTLVMRRTAAGAHSDTGITYDPVAHAYWRIREDAGTIYWDTSPNGSTWTNRRSLAHTMDLTALRVRFFGGYYGTEAADFAYVDDVNVAAPAPGQGTASGTVTTTGTAAGVGRGTTTYTNIFTNPRPGAAVTGWGVNNGGGSVSNTLITDAAGPAGDNARRVTWTAASTSVTGGTVIGPSTNPIAATPAVVYSAAAYVRSSREQRVMLRIQWIDSGNVVLGVDIGAETVVSANTWTEFKTSGYMAPANTVAIRLNVYSVTGTSGVNWEIGDTLDVQAATIVEASSVPLPFHGDRTDTSEKTYDWTGTADASTSTLKAVNAPAGTATGTVTTAGTAVGKRVAGATATGTVTTTGTAVGKRTPKATTAGTVTTAGTATGARAPKATTSGTATTTGTAAGARTPKATAAGTVTTTGTAVGKRTPKANAVGTVTTTGSAVGDTPPNRGAATGTVTTTGIAIGARTPKATATGTVTTTGSSAGKRTPKAATSGTVTTTGSATGKRVAGATAVGIVTTTGSSVGKRTPKATATGTVTTTGSAVGDAPIVAQANGTATGTITVTGTAVGKRAPKATTVGTITATGSAVGKRTPKATTVGIVTTTGSAVGDAPVVGQADGTATGTVTITGTAVGRRTPKAAATGTTMATGAAVGNAPMVGQADGTATGTVTITGSAVGKRTPKATATGTVATTGSAVGSNGEGPSGIVLTSAVLQPTVEYAVALQERYRYDAIMLVADLSALLEDA